MTSHPRVAHVINSIGLGGVPEAVYHLLKHMPEARIGRTIVVLRPLAPGDPAREERHEKLHSLGVPILFVPAGEHKLSTVTGLLNIFEHGKFDIIHAHSYRPNLFARLAALVVKSDSPRIIGHYHNQYDANWERDGTSTLDRHLAARSDLLLACSNAVRDHVSERLGISAKNIRVVANGADLERFTEKVDRVQARRQLGLPPEGPVITLVGRLSEQKGQVDLVKAAPEILARFPSATFVFAGLPDESGTKSAIEAEISRLRLKDSFRFLGFVGCMPELYAATTVLAAPSRWEGFGLMLVEAMAAGVPIVASRAGAIPEVTNNADAALLVEPRDIPALAAALIAVLTNEGLAAQLRAKGRTRAEHFSWRRSANELLCHYDEVLKR